MATDPSLTPKGPVSDVLFEELRATTTPAGPGRETVTSIATKYDEQGRVIQEIRKESRFETDTTNQYRGDRLAEQEFTFPNTQSPRPKVRNSWTYDGTRKLIEYKRTRGDAIENHMTNFKRDSQGRLTSFDYRQGGKDDLFSRTALRYSADGKTVDITDLDKADVVTRSTTQIADDRGHVVLAVIREWDWRTKKAKRPITVHFTYDKQGRLVEQNTEDYDIEPSGGESELPPGKVSISYDDVAHTKKTAYSRKEGVITSTITLDSAGATVAAYFETGTETLDTKLECKYDSRDNWTSCQQIAKRAGVSAVTKDWRRAMTYRQ